MRSQKKRANITVFPPDYNPIGHGPKNIICRQGKRQGGREEGKKKSAVVEKGSKCSGQPNIISVQFRPNFLAKISFGFGISAFISFGIRQKHTFRPKEAVSAKIDLKWTEIRC